MNYKYYLLLHFIIIIWGFTGVIGKELDNTGMGSMPIVVIRMFIGWGTLFIYMLFSGQSFKIDSKGLLKTIGTGFVIAAHWWAFFKSIELSNVSVALIFLSTTALFTSFVEPVIAKKKFDYKELLMGIIVVIGIGIIINDLPISENENYLWAIMLALLAALLAAFFSVVNSVLVKKYNSKTISLYELFGGFVGISLVALLSGDYVIADFNISSYQFLLLFLLGSLCTSFAFLIGVYVMKFIPAYTVNLSVNMEPIYAIILALIFFGESEIMGLNFYLGSLIVIGTIIINAFLKKHKRIRIAKLPQNKKVS